MIFKTCKVLNFLNKSHSGVLIKNTFEVLSTARFTNVSPKPNTTAENVPSKSDIKEIERKVTEAVGKESVNNLKSLFHVKKPHTVGVSFVWDDACAKKIVEKVLMYDEVDKCVILESNPGFGFTTLNFLEAGIPKIHIFQAYFAGTKVYEKYMDRTASYQHSLFQRHGLQDELVLNIVEEASNEGKICKIVGATTHHKFLSSLPRQILNKNLWDLFSSTEFYMLVSEQVHGRVTNYRLSMTRFFTYCLFSCLFDVEVLGEFPTSAFLPVLETNAMYLLKIKKKKRDDMPIREDLIPEYITFLKILGSSKSNLIISTLDFGYYAAWKFWLEKTKLCLVLPRTRYFVHFSSLEHLQWIVDLLFVHVPLHEQQIDYPLKMFKAGKVNEISGTGQWVPGCGLKFISKGIRLTTEVKDISADESLKLFNFFTECEEYDNFKEMHKVLENEEKERKGK